ncbi:ATP-grasp domain-containing protein (plasmid) [Acidiphilium multivorum]|uniref:ATP-grasp domain-containing protein n=1 Tax=Acidiphilium multivorum TaxID=62140 RepID=UPI001F4BD66C|nr:ATP-grasp domain-containing protein [Acidiphilium multivorum]UNC16586.1 ATP-grasp domain-containing protein [Acidiphilium multivorum]
MPTLDRPTMLIVGGGFPQLSLIEAVRARGFRVAVAEDREDSPGFAIADRHVHANRYDFEGIVAALGDDLPNFVVSGGADKAVLIAARLAEAFGLPCPIPSGIARFPTEKARYRKVFGEIGVSVPQAESAASGAEAAQIAKRLGYPVVLKPNDGIGQVGVNRVDTAEVLETAFAEAAGASQDGTVVIEEYLDGPEVGVNGLVDHRGHFTLLTLGIRSASQQPGAAFGVALGKSIPYARSAEIEADITCNLQMICTELGLRNVPIYAQMKDSTRGVRLIEAMPRLGGGEDPRLVHLKSGMDLSAAVVDAAAGVQLEVAPYRTGPGVGAVHAEFLTAPQGRIETITGFPIEHPSIGYQELFVGPGHIVPEVKSSHSRLGVVAFTGDSVKALTAVAKEVLGQIEIVTTPPSRCP